MVIVIKHIWAQEPYGLLLLCKHLVIHLVSSPTDGHVGVRQDFFLPFYFYFSLFFSVMFGQRFPRHRNIRGASSTNAQFCYGLLQLLTEQGVWPQSAKLCNRLSSFFSSGYIIALCIIVKSHNKLYCDPHTRIEHVCYSWQHWGVRTREQLHMPASNLIWCALCIR